MKGGEAAHRDLLPGRGEKGVKEQLSGPMTQCCELLGLSNHLKSPYVTAGMAHHGTHPDFPVSSAWGNMSSFLLSKFMVPHVSRLGTKPLRG